MPLVSKTHGDPIFMKGPYFLDQPVIELPSPLPRQERHDRFATANEFRLVAPTAVLSVGKRDPRGVTAIRLNLLIDDCAINPHIDWPLMHYLQRYLCLSVASLDTLGSGQKMSFSST
jgi:hypothetical protein